jgi:transposase
MIPTQVRIFVCSEPVDMRCGFDRLAQLARERVGADPQSGALFVFGGKRAMRLKVLWFDQNGFCLLYKRFHRAVFHLPIDGAHAYVQVDGAQLATILQGRAVDRKKRSRRAKPLLTDDRGELSMQP